MNNNSPKNGWRQTIERWLVLASVVLLYYFMSQNAAMVEQLGRPTDIVLGVIIGYYFNK